MHVEVQLSTMIIHGCGFGRDYLIGDVRSPVAFTARKGSASVSERWNSPSLLGIGSVLEGLGACDLGRGARHGRHRARTIHNR